MNQHLTLLMGNCHHRTYLPHRIARGGVDPRQILTQIEPMTDVPSAYEAFNERRPGWIEVELEPAP